MYRLIIRLNNRLIKWRRVRVPPANLLLLLPHCLHRDSCPHSITGNIDACRRCGQCPIAALLELRDRYGLIAGAVGGGRQALAQTKRPAVRAVVAVACEKELALGILMAFPKPVLAVTNATPNGPCRNTTVDINQVAAAVEQLLVSRPAAAASAPP